MTLHSVLTYSFAALLPLMALMFLRAEILSLVSKRFEARTWSALSWLLLLGLIAWLAFPHWLRQLLTDWQLALMVYGILMAWRVMVRRQDWLLRGLVLTCYGLAVLDLAKRFASSELWHDPSQLLAHSNSMPNLMLGLIVLSVVLPLGLVSVLYRQVHRIKKSALHDSSP